MYDMHLNKMANCHTILGALTDVIVCHFQTPSTTTTNSTEASIYHGNFPPNLQCFKTGIQDSPDNKDK